MTRTAASADVNVKTPWANVFVGQGRYLCERAMGPRGRACIGARARVRRAAQEHARIYDTQSCKVEFDDDGCVIKDLDWGK
jgi:hypothetical protein